MARQQCGNTYVAAGADGVHLLRTRTLSSPTSVTRKPSPLCTEVTLPEPTAADLYDHVTDGAVAVNTSGIGVGAVADVDDSPSHSSTSRSGTSHNSEHSRECEDFFVVETKATLQPYKAVYRTQSEFVTPKVNCDFIGASGSAGPGLLSSSHAVASSIDIRSRNCTPQSAFSVSDRDSASVDSTTPTADGDNLMGTGRECAFVSALPAPHVTSKPKPLDHMLHMDENIASPVRTKSPLPTVIHNVTRSTSPFFSATTASVMVGSQPVDSPNAPHRAARFAAPAAGTSSPLRPSL